MTISVHPWADSKVTKFLQEKLAAISDRKSERQIAAEAGFKSLNIVNMMKNGGAKVPLDRVIQLARALEVDPAYLFRLALEQQLTNVNLPDDFFARTILSDNEVEIIECIREASGNSDPGLNDRRRQELKTLFS